MSLSASTAKRSRVTRKLTRLISEIAPDQSGKNSHRFYATAGEQGLHGERFAKRPMPKFENGKLCIQRPPAGWEKTRDGQAQGNAAVQRFSERRDAQGMGPFQAVRVGNFRVACRAKAAKIGRKRLCRWASSWPTTLGVEGRGDGE